MAADSAASRRWRSATAGLSRTDTSCKRLKSNEAIREAVAANLGVSVVSRHALQAKAADYGVAVLKVAGFPVESNWHVVHRKGKQLSPIARVFQAHLLALRDC